MAKQYKWVALQGIQCRDENNQPQFVTPKSNKGTGLFNAKFDQDRARKLIAMGFMRVATARDHEALNPAVAVDIELPEDEPDPEKEVDALSGMTVVNLKALAETEGVDISAVTKKDDIIAAIRAARESAKGDATDPFA